MLYSDLFSPTKLKNELGRSGALPKKSLGQNFLIDKNSVERVIKACQLSKEHTALEIGAGLGVLTAPLSNGAGRVIAYELDARLLPLLREVVKNCVNVEIKQEDARTAVFSFPPTALAGAPRSIVVGNLPYYATGRILRQIFTSDPLPERIVVTVQKEVGERLMARPGALSLLGVAAQLYGAPKRIAVLPKTAFFPKPSVDSMVVRIDKWADAPTSGELAGLFWLIKAGFSSKRKLLASNLARALGISREVAQNALFEANLVKTARAQELSIPAWRALFHTLRGVWYNELKSQKSKRKSQNHNSKPKFSSSLKVLSCSFEI